MKTAKTMEKVIIPPIFQPPAINIANAKYPIDCTFPLKAIVRNKNNAPAIPAKRLDKITPIHLYLITFIPLAFAACGFSPIAKYRNPIVVFFIIK